MDTHYYKKYKKYKNLYKTSKQNKYYGGGDDGLGLGSLDSGSSGDSGLGGLMGTGAGTGTGTGAGTGATNNQPKVKRSDLDDLEKDTVKQLNTYVEHYGRFENKLRQCMEKCKMRLPVCVTDNVRDLSDGYHTLQKLYHLRMGEQGFVDFDTDDSKKKSKK